MVASAHFIVAFFLAFANQWVPSQAAQVKDPQDANSLMRMAEDQEVENNDIQEKESGSQNWVCPAGKCLYNRAKSTNFAEECPSDAVDSIWKCFCRCVAANPQCQAFYNGDCRDCKTDPCLRAFHKMCPATKGNKAARTCGRKIYAMATEDCKLGRTQEESCPPKGWSSLAGNMTSDEAAQAAQEETVAASLEETLSGKRSC